MPAWCTSSDCQAATDEIELEIKTRGWDLLIRASSKDQLDLGEDQRRQFTIHLQCQYPTAQKNTAAWFKDNGTGQAMEKCFYYLHSNSQPDTQPYNQ